jgi:hypothetical protein
MAGDHQVISADDISLGRSDPEVQNAVECKAEKLSGVFPNESAKLLLLFLHESNLAQLLKPAHGSGIVARMLAARPQPGGLVIVRHVHLERADRTSEKKGTSEG